MDTGRNGDNVDDGINCPDFVKMNFFNGDVVDLCFAGAEEFESLNGSLFYRGGYL